MVLSEDKKNEIISKEEDYFRNALKATEELIFTGKQNQIINEEMVKVLEKKLKEFE